MSAPSGDEARHVPMLTRDMAVEMEAGKRASVAMSIQGSQAAPSMRSMWTIWADM